MGNPLKGADPESLDAAAFSPTDVGSSSATDCPSSPPPSDARHSPGMEPMSLSADTDPSTVVGSLDPFATGSLPSLQIFLHFLPIKVIVS